MYETDLEGKNYLHHFYKDLDRALGALAAAEGAPFAVLPAPHLNHLAAASRCSREAGNHI